MKCTFLLSTSLAAFLAVSYNRAAAQDSSVVKNRTFPSDSENSLVGDYLGWGYDAIAGRFADASALKTPIYQVSTFTKPTMGTAGDYVFNRVTVTDQREKSGSSTLGFARKLSANLSLGVDTGMFSGEISANTASGEKGGTDSYYASITDTRIVFTAQLDQAKVDPTVLAEMGKLSPRQIINKYGTHYTTGVELGGYVRFTHSEQATADSTTSSVMANLKATYNGVSAPGGGNSSNENSSLIKKGSTKLHFQGGIQVGLTAENFFKDGTRDMIDGQLAKWAASLSTNPGFAGFLPNGLQPLWMLPGLSSDKAAALQTEVKAYAKEKAAGLFDPKAPVAREQVARNGSFCLWHHNNTWLSNYENAAQYWVRLGGPVKFQFLECGDGKLNSGDYVQFTTTQGMPGGYGTYNIFSVFTKDYCYLYSKDGSGNYYSGQNWRIWKGARGELGAIHYGDKVVLESLYYGNSVTYLVQNGNYVTTKASPETWIITKEGVEPQ